MKLILTVLTMGAIGAILASANVNVKDSWQAWAIIALAAVNGLIGAIRA